MDKIFKYSEYNGEIIITGLKESVSDTSIVIPETINGMPVTAIGAKAFRSTSITDIKIGENQPLLRLFNHADPDLQCGNIVIYQGCTIHASSPIKSTFVKSSLKFF